MSPSLGHTTPPLHTGANRMNKTSAVVVNIVWCRTSAAPHTRTRNHTNAYSHGARGGQRHMHTRTNTRTCTGKVKWAHSKRDRKKNNAPNTHTHTYCASHTHTHTVVQSVEQACWVAVSTYSAAMATSSMAIDSAAKWVRAWERDNLA